jgi:hypothetical protein
LGGLNPAAYTSGLGRIASPSRPERTWSDRERKASNTRKLSTLKTVLTVPSNLSKGEC